MWRLKLSKIIWGDLVSVVIPAYNHQLYIKEALDSVYNQTYKNIELIFLDDCSKDKTLELAQQWALEKKAKKRFARVIIEKNSANLGAYDTINKGLSLAHGNALTILNSDDMYSLNRIDELMRAAEKNQADWLLSGIRVIDDVNERVFSEFAIDIEESVDHASNYPAVSFAFLRKNIAATTGNLFFSRELYDKVGKFQNLKYCHDWDFALQACLISEPTIVNQALYNYRIHNTNSFADLKLEQHLDPQKVYWRYFSACRAGKCRNPDAPWISNWPGFFEKWVEDDPTLKWVFNLVGHDTVKFDLLSNSIAHSLKPRKIG